jgi:uncharacterized cupredoxin-like copper-binding protein
LNRKEDAMKRDRSIGARLAGSGIAAAAFLLVASSCSDDSHGAKGTVVNVTLREFSVTPDRASAPEGKVTFDVSNAGEDEHEFLVIKTDLAADALPTEENGSYEEDGPGTDLLDEIELVEPGGMEELHIDLDPGKYVLICNMVHTEDNGEVEVHYQLGMRTPFTVTSD